MLVDDPGYSRLCGTVLFVGDCAQSDKEAEEMREWKETVEEVRSTPLIMAQILGRPRAKPWDYVKGRRFRCCGGLKPLHRPYCPQGEDTTINIPRFASISTRGIPTDILLF